MISIFLWNVVMYYTRQDTWKCWNYMEPGKEGFIMLDVYWYTSAGDDLHLSWLPQTAHKPILQYTTKWLGSIIVLSFYLYCLHLVFPTLPFFNVYLKKRQHICSHVEQSLNYIIMRTVSQLYYHGERVAVSFS